MMTLPILKLVPRLAASGSLATFCLLSASCKLPPREAWNNVQQHGLLPVLFDNHSGAPKTPGTPTTAIAENSANPAPATPEQANALRVQAVKQPEIASIPFATPVPGRQGYVYSPHTQGKKLVDVRNFAPGAEVRCPYTLQAFHVPDFAALASTPPVSKPKPQRSIAEVATRTDRESQDSDLGVITLPNPKITPAPAPTSDAAEIPYGSRVAGRPGFVYSPFADKNQLVDVAGIAPGVEVKCPYSNKLFRVPEPLPEEVTPAPANVIPPAPPAPPAPSPAPELPATPEAKPQPAAATPAPVSTSAPTAEWVDKEKNQVQSPFGSPGQLIDVSGRAPGSTMQCPFTNKEFVIPAH